MKLNIFSPLPPVFSDVANYTMRVATALRTMADVTLWTAQAQPPEVPDGFAVQMFEPGRVPWKLLNDADLNIYNLGNNASYHQAIFDVARQAPGLLVLHDSRLQHFFARYSETPGADRAFYLDCMRRFHGPEALADAEAFLAGAIGIDTLVDRYPLTLAALDTALAAIIHNPADGAALAGQTRTPVFVLPLPYPAGPTRLPRPPGQVLRLVIFGFIGLNRRLDSILEALAGISDHAIRLDIYGKLEEAERIEAQIAGYDLADRVHCHGYVPEAELDAALAAADLAFNLRFPTMGEASGSQMRIWNAALPSLVTRIGWYAELPQDAVFFVEPGHEVEMIRVHLAGLRSDPERYLQAGARGRAVLVERHDPTRYAAALLSAMAQIDTLHARHQAIGLSRTAAAHLLDMTGVAGVELGAGQVADAISALTAAPGR